MYDGHKPLLASLAVKSAPAPVDLENTFVDASTGLIHERGADGPLVERLLGLTAGSLQLSTPVTAAREGLDPDLIRASAREQLAAVTHITRGDVDQQDPDLMRIGQRSATVLTEQETDPVDPELVRFCGRGVGVFSTLMTKAEVDPTDPDTVRTCRH